MARTDRTWSATARFFHWTIAVLILVQGSIGLVMVNLPRRPSIIPVYTLHKSIGLTILALAVARLLWRFCYTRPAPLPMPGWQDMLSRVTHVLLYVLIFAAPLSGWLFDSASGLRPLLWWGVLRMPSLTGGPAPDLKVFAEGLHVALVWTLFVVAALHIAAALKHHFFDRDDTLRRMLPWARQRAPEPSRGDH